MPQNYVARVEQPDASTGAAAVVRFFAALTELKNQVVFQFFFSDRYPPVFDGQFYGVLFFLHFNFHPGAALLAFAPTVFDGIVDQAV